jgi:peptide/nickel transport system substrate-binding protein
MRSKTVYFVISLIVLFSMVVGLTTTAAQSLHTSKQLTALQPGMTSAEVLAALPRDQTLYFNGQQWGEVTCWNPYSSDCNNAMAIAQQDNARVTMFETPYMYNMLDGGIYPLLADGPYSWNEAGTVVTFTLKTAAHWNDGSPVTADDVAYTWYANVTYETLAGVSYQDYIEDILAVDDQTLMVISYLTNNYVIQKAWTQVLEARNGHDAEQIKSDPAEDVIYSGPYHKFIADDTIVVLERDDNYWGQDASMWGKLPTPKYLAHVIYPDNDAGLEAIKTGKVDVSQQFIPNVQDLWLYDRLPISTYLPEAPYMLGTSMPTAFYNLSAYGLDNVAIRKAIAIAINYDSIIAEAMSNQSDTFDQVPRSIMNSSPYEQGLYDHDAVKDLQWAGNDIAGANQLLDDAGIIDTNDDGWREYNGETLYYTATCPLGWTDWMAAIEILADIAPTIGISITTNYPDWGTYLNVVTNWSTLEETRNYDIFMMWSDGAGSSQPWGRVRHLISSEFAGTDGNWNGNWGGYSKAEADALIQAIPGETDPVVLKQYYTDLTEIYLTDVPSFSLMYRPQLFYTVNDLVWKNFPHQGDGTNPPIPPLILTDGYSIAGLYNLYIPNQIFAPLINR